MADSVAVPSFLSVWFTFLSDDPLARLLQGVMLLCGVLAVFLIFYTTRDILLRTQSFLLTLLCILIVTLLPVVGFFLYLLIRPPRTIKERELFEMVQELLEKKGKASQAKGALSSPKKEEKAEKKK